MQTKLVDICVFNNQYENHRGHKLRVTQKRDMAVKHTPTILGSVKRDGVFRWLEEMIPLGTVPIRPCLESVLSSGQRVL